jgi:hypothetical protein
VNAGDTLGMIYSRNAAQSLPPRQRIQSAYTIGDESPREQLQLIKEVITA